MVNDRLMAGTLGGLSVLESGVVKRELHDVELAFATQLDDRDRSLRFRCFRRDIRSGGHSALGRRHVAQLSRRGFTAYEINPGAMAATQDKVYAGTLGKGLLMYDRSDNRWHAITQGFALA